MVKKYSTLKASFGMLVIAILALSMSAAILAEEVSELGTESPTYWIEKAGLKPSGELTIYSYKDDMARDQSITKMFLEEYPDVKIDWVAIPYSEYAAKIAMELETKTADFDLMWTWGAWTNQFKDYLEDITDRIPEELKNDIVPGVHKAVGYGDKWFGIPLYIGIWGIQYNKDILKKAGYDECPVTLDEFLKCAEDCTIYKEASKIPESYGFTGVCQRGQSWMPVFYMLLKNVGGEYWNNDPNNPKAMFNNEFGVRALQVEKALYKSDFSDPVMASADPGQARSSMASGKVGLSLSYMGWVFSEAKNNFPENANKLGWSKVPADPGNESYCVSGDMGFVMRKGTKNIDTALAYCLFYASNEIQKWRNVNDGFCPVRESIVNDKEFLSEYPYIPISLEMASTSVRYTEPNMTEIENGCIPIFEKYFDGNIDEKETLSQLESLFYTAWE